MVLFMYIVATGHVMKTMRTPREFIPQHTGLVAPPNKATFNSLSCHAHFTHLRDESGNLRKFFVTQVIITDESNDSRIFG